MGSNEGKINVEGKQISEKSIDEGEEHRKCDKNVAVEGELKSI